MRGPARRPALIVGLSLVLAGCGLELAGHPVVTSWGQGAILALAVLVVYLLLTRRPVVTPAGPPPPGVIVWEIDRAWTVPCVDGDMEGTGLTIGRAAGSSVLDWYPEGSEGLAFLRRADASGRPTKGDLVFTGGHGRTVHLRTSTRPRPAGGLLCCGVVVTDLVDDKRGLESAAADLRVQLQQERDRNAALKKEAKGLRGLPAPDPVEP